ncbi:MULTISPECIES: hypothetical protein [Acetobacter]|uniref:hypothetical protein n=1 Tax=Acetobacter TaxID=434 RepID=UPI00337BCFD9
MVAAEQANATLTGSAVNTGLIYGTQGINLKSGEQIDNTNGRIGANGTIAVSGASLPSVISSFHPPLTPTPSHDTFIVSKLSLSGSPRPFSQPEIHSKPTTLKLKNLT